MKKMQKLGLFTTWVLISVVLFNSHMEFTSIQDQAGMPDVPLIEWGGKANTAADPDAFISIWDTTLISEGSSASNQVSLPLESGGTYDFTVVWGDSTSDTITSWDQDEVTHTYSSPGVYTINITGTITGWRFNNVGDPLKIGEIQQWGALKVGNSGSYFYGCENLHLTTNDSLDLTGTTTLYSAFRECENIGSSGNLNAWDVSSVTDMMYMFMGSIFNQPLDAWDVSSVTYMMYVFRDVPSFNQSLDVWDVSSVTSMGSMFSGASSFNHPLNAWDISSVTDMSRMFSGASSFNQSLSAWDVSSVMNMRSMFYNAHSFNQPLSSWNVSSVTAMNDMFQGVTLSTSNYDSILLSWSQLPLQSDVVFDAGYSQYSVELGGDPGPVEIARQEIKDLFGWTITDGGPASTNNSKEEIVGFPPVWFGVILLGSLIGLVASLGTRRR